MGRESRRLQWRRVGGEKPGGEASWLGMMGCGSAPDRRPGSPRNREGTGLSDFETGSGGREGRCDGSKRTQPNGHRTRRARKTQGGKRQQTGERKERETRTRVARAPGRGAAVGFTHSPGAFSWAP